LHGSIENIVAPLVDRFRAEYENDDHFRISGDDKRDWGIFFTGPIYRIPEMVLPNIDSAMDETLAKTLQDPDIVDRRLQLQVVQAASRLRNAANYKKELFATNSAMPDYKLFSLLLCRRITLLMSPPDVSFIIGSKPIVTFGSGDLHNTGKMVLIPISINVAILEQIADSDSAETDLLFVDSRYLYNKRELTAKVSVDIGIVRVTGFDVRQINERIFGQGNSVAARDIDDINTLIGVGS